MSSQKPAGTQAKGQATLLGFFKKVDQAKSKSNTGNGTASREAVPGPSQPSFTASRTVTAAKTAVYAKNGPIPSPPSSVSGGSVSPVASSSKPSSVSKRPSIGGPRDGVFVPSAGSSKISSKPATISPAADEQPPTPPPSSPPPVRSHDKVHTAVDDDDDEEMPSVTRRRSAAKKRKSYFESGSEGEGDDGSDYEQDVKRSSKTIPHDEDDDDDDDDDDMEALSDASSSPVPSSTNRKKGSCATKRPNKTAGASQAKRPRSSLSAFGANSSRPAPPAPRPALPHASSSATSSSSMDSSAKAATGFAFLNDRRDMDGNRPGDADFDPRTLLIPARAWGDMTNFEKQYFEIKQYNMDTILMFQKGKFYEMFLEDARIAHQKLDLKLTDRGRMPMVGVPESSFDLFATKLLALGFKVGRVDQMETAVAMGMRQKASSGEIVRRELRHVMTSGTMIDGLEDDQANYCIALVEEIHQVEGQDDVISFGVCALDAATSDFNLSHWRDDLQRSQLETLLTSLRVKEVIHKKGQLSRETSRLIRNCVAADCRITMLREGKEWFSPEATRSEILELFGDEEGAVPEAILAVQDNEVAMSSLAGMFAYLAQLSLLKDLTSSKNFSLLEHRKTAGGQPMHMDANTLSHLCVLANEDGSDAGTLHRLLNRCFTPAGKRLFKLWLTHPMSDMTAINARQEAVEDMLGNMDFEECLARLKKLPDFERLIPKVASGKIKPGEFTRLLSSFKKMTPIVDDLVSHAASFTSELVKKLLYTIPNVASLAAHLDAMFVAEEDGSFQPRDGVDEDYDQAQAAVDAVEEELESELKKYRKQLGLGAQKSGGCNWKHRGTNEIYQVEVPKKTRVPNDWAIVSQTNASVGYYSPSLRALVQSLKEARETRVAALKAFHAQLFIKFNEKAPSYLMAVRALAELDCLHSLALASYALGEPTCRPTLIDCDTALVDFEELRHPCIASATDFIANDIQMGGDAAEVIVLTGGNMAGKSTTARTTATGVILAQLGCRVPAKSATLSPADRICSRMGANDQIFKNSSTFMVEMLEASRIVKDCTPRSLVIMDELGRGTSTFDGHAIAHAVLHHLIARTRCLCFFLTHYLQLAYDFQGYPRCANKHMAVVVDDEKREVVFTYKLVEGVAESSYGTQVAHLAGVPAKICDRANDISLEFAAATKEQQAQRTTSALPMATLSDFAYLFKLGSGPAEPQVNTQQIVSQLNVIRSQITRVVSADAVMAEGDAHLYATAAPIGLTTSDQSKLSKRSGSYASGGRRARRALADRDNTSWSSDEDSVPSVKRVRSDSVVTKETRALMSTKTFQETTPKRKVLAPFQRQSAEQLILDLGQKVQVTCHECSMSYDRSSPDDVALHAKHHDRTLKGVEWSNKGHWSAGELLSRTYIDKATIARVLGRAIVASAEKKSFEPGKSVTCSASDALFTRGLVGDDKVDVQILRYSLADVTKARSPLHAAAQPMTLQSKLSEVLSAVDTYLGASQMEEESLRHCKLLIAVCCNRVLGSLVVTTNIPAGSARKVLQKDIVAALAAKGEHGDSSGMSHANDAVFASSQPLDPSETPPVGIHRIYTLPSLRRKGLAARLLDAALEHSVYGLNAEELVRSKSNRGRKSEVVAFSQPTDAGRSLARAWLKDEDLIVFQE